MRKPTAIEAFIEERKNLESVNGRRGNGICIHKKRSIEPGVMYCPDPFCMVLSVRMDFLGSYEFHAGTNHLFFSYQDAKDYLDGKQTLVDLVRPRLVEGEEE